MDDIKIKLWRKDFRNINPHQGINGFNRVLKRLGIRNNLWPSIWMIMVYVTSSDKAIKNSICELYNKKLEPIKQGEGQ